MCIERSEVDETRGVNETLFGGGASAPAPAAAAAAELEGDAIIGDDSDEVIDSTDVPAEVAATRQSRQFSSNIRMTTCNDEGLTYVCETK